MLAIPKKNFAGLVLLALVVAVPANAGMIFNTTFDSSVLAEPDASQWESAFNYVTSLYSSLFSDNITVNLTLKASPGTSVLGESNTQLVILNGGYSQLRSALVADETTANDVTAVNSLPVNDPTGGSSEWVVSRAQAKALGLISGTSSVSDGTVTIGDGYSYTFDPNDRAVSGEYDFIGIAEHEITEVMGRIGLLGVVLQNGQGQNLPPSFGVLDLFGYTSAGHMSLNQTNTGVYFSINGGVTDLYGYNNPGNGGDLKDWANGQGPDSYNAFSSAGVENNISATDLEEMDVIGYDFDVPEPSSFLALLIGALFIGWRLRRRVV